MPDNKNIVVKFGSCSHWRRPHQTRTKAAGGFAWTSGYGEQKSGKISNGKLPKLDWSILLKKENDTWNTIKRCPRRAKLIRIALPSRTGRHKQAAVHTDWRIGRKSFQRLYFFRCANGIWKLLDTDERNTD